MEVAPWRMGSVDGLGRSRSNEHQLEVKRKMRMESCKVLQALRGDAVYPGSSRSAGGAAMRWGPTKLAPAELRPRCGARRARTSGPGGSATSPHCVSQWLPRSREREREGGRFRESERGGQVGRMNTWTTRSRSAHESKGREIPTTWTWCRIHIVFWREPTERGASPLDYIKNNWKSLVTTQGDPIALCGGYTGAKKEMPTAKTGYHRGRAKPTLPND
jgi:hypothetical protein